MGCWERPDRFSMMVGSPARRENLLATSAERRRWTVVPDDGRDQDSNRREAVRPPPCRGCFGISVQGESPDQPVASAAELSGGVPTLWRAQALCKGGPSFRAMGASPSSGRGGASRRWMQVHLRLGIVLFGEARNRLIGMGQRSIPGRASVLEPPASGWLERRKPFRPNCGPPVLQRRQLLADGGRR